MARFSDLFDNSVFLLRQLSGDECGWSVSQSCVGVADDDVGGRRCGAGATSCAVGRCRCVLCRSEWRRSAVAQRCVVDCCRREIVESSSCCFIIFVVVVGGGGVECCRFVATFRLCAASGGARQQRSAETSDAESVCVAAHEHQRSRDGQLCQDDCRVGTKECWRCCCIGDISNEHSRNSKTILFGFCLRDSQTRKTTK